MSKTLFNLKVNNPGAVPKFAKDIIWTGLRATAQFRTLPNFLIIGGQKCGTTSLYSYLSAHPQILLSLKKEPSYFGDNYCKGVNWYRAHFPLEVTRRLTARNAQSPVMVGEASTASLFHPCAAEQAFKTNNKFKIVVMTREPVSRAISHYFFYRKKGMEVRPIERAFSEACSTFTSDLETWRNWNGTISALESKIDTYLIRGLYDQQLEQWQNYFGQQNVLRLKSEEFSSNSELELEKVSEFLGINTFQPITTKRFNKGQYKDVPDSVSEQLREFFQNASGKY